MLTQDQIAEAATALFRAEADNRPTTPISVRFPDADIDDAYRISMAVTRLKLAAGRTVKGHKVGLTSKVMQELRGASEPDFGPMFDDWFVPDGGTVSRRRMNHPLVEMELAFVLGDALDGGDVDAAAVRRATAVVRPCIEIIDNRQSGRGPRPLVDSIADAAGCGRVVLGGREVGLDDIDTRAVSGGLAINGEVRERGSSDAVMGDPVNAVVWLANTLHRFGVTLERGHIVLSGSFIKAIPFEPGDHVAARFDGLGEVTFSAD